MGKIHNQLAMGCLLTACILVHGCKPSQKTISNYIYFEKNLTSLDSITIQLKEPIIQKNDQLSIQVSSATLNQEQAAVFNLMNAQSGGSQGGTSSIGYFVDLDGNINIPIIGRVKASGRTLKELEGDLIRYLDPYVKNPIVNLRLINFRILLMGEVLQKGWMTFTNQKATVVEALVSAGVSEFGIKDSVLLIRQGLEGKMESHRLDITDARIFQSPYFQLQQNDMLYVLPNPSKILQFERANSPFFRDLPIYMGLIASILGFATLMITIAK